MLLTLMLLANNNKIIIIIIIIIIVQLIEQDGQVVIPTRPMDSVKKANLFKLGFGTFWEKAAHSVDHMFSLYLSICNFNFSYFPFWFEGWIWVLIASVPGLCILFTST